MKSYEEMLKQMNDRRARLSVELKIKELAFNTEAVQEYRKAMQLCRTAWDLGVPLKRYNQEVIESAKKIWNGFGIILNPDGYPVSIGFDSVWTDGEELFQMDNCPMAHRLQAMTAMESYSKWLVGAICSWLEEYV